MSDQERYRPPDEIQPGWSVLLDDEWREVVAVLIGPGVHSFMVKPEEGKKSWGYVSPDAQVMSRPPHVE